MGSISASVNMLLWLTVGALLHVAAAQQPADICSAVEQKCSTLPALRAQQGGGSLGISPETICDSFRQYTAFGCSIMNYLETELACRDKNPVCTGSFQTRAATTSRNGRPIPYPLTEQRPLPANLSTSLFSIEGPAYYWYWKNLYNFEAWASCAATNSTRTVTRGTPYNPTNANANWLVPQGWRVYSTIWLKDGQANPGDYWPFATVVTSGDMMTIFIRGTETCIDWLTDFQWTQSQYTMPVMYPGKTHDGFSKVAASLWPGIQEALDSLVLSKFSKIKYVAISGHSLGAAVTTLVSYAAQEYLNRYLRYGKHHRYITVDALLFAPPTVGDSAFAAAFGKAVNARRIEFVYDVVPQLPCTPTMLACNNTLIPTTNPSGATVWPYADVPGSLVLLPANMPAQPQVWGYLNEIIVTEVGPFADATHTCSYNCYMSQFVHDNNNLCLLWNTTVGGGQGTYCFEFPVGNSSYPSPS